MSGEPVFTIGFTKKPARQFFELVRDAGVKRIVDVRLNNTSQLSGFAKRDDLAYFLREICGLGYVHAPDLAPTKEMLDEYRKGGGDWNRYERRFRDLMRTRRIEQELDRTVVEGGCLLCSEAEPHRCHRRLVAEYLADEWGDIEIRHLE